MNLSFSIAPYFDDFSDEKGFIKILFKPAFAVQTRELNQIQTILQNQLKKLSDSLYKHGSPIINGETGYDLKATWVVVEPIIDQGFPKNYFDEFIGKEIVGSITNIHAYISAFDQTTNKLFIKYLSAGTSSEEVFSQSELLNILNVHDEIETNVCRTSSDENYVGTGSRAYIKSGTYYIDGNFVNVSEQSIILDSTSQIPSVKIGLLIDEEIITVSEDETLYDNANSSTNYTAPGADRYKISLTLISKDIDEEADDNFIELLRLEKGNPTKWVKYKEYSSLGDTMARRTYDESGNYTVSGLGMNVSEHLNDGKNNGIYTEEEGGDKNKFVVRVAPGKAYIKGYEIEKYGTSDITFDKSREFVYENNANIIADWKNYIIVSDISILPNIKSDITIFFIKANTIENYQNNIAGWCKIRGIERLYGTGNDLIYKLYIYDQNWHDNETFSKVGMLYSPGTYGFSAKLVTQYQITNTSGTFQVGETVTAPSDRNVIVKMWDNNNYILYANKGSTDFIDTSEYVSGGTSKATGVIANKLNLIGGQNISAIFKIPYDDAKTIRSTDGTSDTTYITTKVFENIQLDSAGTGTINTDGTDTFSNTNVLVSVMTGGVSEELQATLLSPGSLSISLGSSYANKQVRVVADVTRNGATEKKKQYRTTSITISNTKNQQVFSLKKSDIYKVTGVYMSSDHDTAPDKDVDENIVSTCDIDDGQREAHYRNAFVTLPSIATGQILIEYSYFDVSGTGASDYTSIDSYETLIIDGKPYIESTPEFKSLNRVVNLRNYLDFRPRVSDNAANRIMVAAKSGDNILQINGTKSAVNDMFVGMTVYGYGVPTGTTITAIDQENPTKVTISNALTADVAAGKRILFGIKATLDGLTMYGESNVSKSYIVKSNVPIRIDYYHYVPRKDILSIKEDGEFQVQKGVASINPKVPKEPKDNMILAYVNIPAYTYSATDVEISIVDQKRFTMEDIGKLERRIENLEYQTTLNALENQLNNIRITDSATGLDRLKTGLIADNFTSSDMADTNNLDLLYTLDWNGNFIFPAAISRSVKLKQNQAASTNFKRVNGKITLPFTEEILNQNAYASRSVNVNEYMYANWIGNMTLTPNQDFWVDENKIPDANITYYDASQNYTITNVINRTVTFGGSGHGSWTQTQNSYTYETVPVNYYTETNIVGTTLIPYIRENKIKINVDGLKPNTKVNPFFDDKRVRQYCSLDNITYDVDLVADEEGKLEFYFNIPGGVFMTGEREFKITNQFTTEDPEGAGTWAQAPYTANGLLQTKQTTNYTITATKTTVTSVVTRHRDVDPLAQSFYINDQSGVFITSVDIFMRYKHKSIPLTVEIREMDNGYPSENLIVGGRVVKYPNEINVSELSNIPTNIKFDFPLYLEGNKEYCIVLITDCADYEAWTSKLGDYDIYATTTKIDKQPVLGSLFKSQNNRTWTADQQSDLKYTLYRAKFDIKSECVIQFENENLQSVEMIPAPLSFVTDSPVVTIRLLNHGLFDTGNSLFKLDLPAGTYCGIPHTVLNQPYLANVIDDTEFTITLPQNATETGSPIITNAKAFINYNYDSFVPNVEHINYQGTSVDWSFLPVTGKTIGDTSRTPYNFESKQEMTYNRLKRVYLNNTMTVASKINEDSQLSGNKSLTLYAKLKSENDFVSPVLYCNDFGADAEFIMYDNIVNNPKNNEDFLYADQSLNHFNFVTIPINLSLQATMLKVYVEANVPSDSNLRIFYRTTDGAESDIGLTVWKEFERPYPFVTSNMFDTPNEYSYTVENVNSFSCFQIKISGTSTNKAQVPVINNYRIIALA